MTRLLPSNAARWSVLSTALSLKRMVESVVRVKGESRTLSMRSWGVRPMMSPKAAGLCDAEAADVGRQQHACEEEELEANDETVEEATLVDAELATDEENDELL